MFRHAWRTFKMPLTWWGRPRPSKQPRLRHRRAQCKDRDAAQLAGTHGSDVRRADAPRREGSVLHEDATVLEGCRLRRLLRTRGLASRAAAAPHGSGGRLPQPLPVTPLAGLWRSAAYVPCGTAGPRSPLSRAAAALRSGCSRHHSSAARLLAPAVPAPWLLQATGGAGPPLRAGVHVRSGRVCSPVCPPSRPDGAATLIARFRRPARIDDGSHCRVWSHVQRYRRAGEGRGARTEKR